jgi:hypothetical protein
MAKYQRRNSGLALPRGLERRRIFSDLVVGSPSDVFRMFPAPLANRGRPVTDGFIAIRPLTDQEASMWCAA